MCSHEISRSFSVSYFWTPPTSSEYTNFEIQNNSFHSVFVQMITKALSFCNLRHEKPPLLRIVSIIWHWFGLSLLCTMKNEIHSLRHSESFHLKIYLALDSDDRFLLDGTKAKDALQSSDCFEIHWIVCDFPKGHVYSLWRECAQHAWKDGADYMCLMGDDVELLDDSWLLDIAHIFQCYPITMRSWQDLVVSHIWKLPFRGWCQLSLSFWGFTWTFSVWTFSVKSYWIVYQSNTLLLPSMHLQMASLQTLKMTPATFLHAAYGTAITKHFNLTY